MKEKEDFPKEILKINAESVALVSRARRYRKHNAFPISKVTEKFRRPLKRRMRA